MEGGRVGVMGVLVGEARGVHEGVLVDVEVSVRVGDKLGVGVGREAASSWMRAKTYPVQ
jgi:GTP cyclohydrolase III